jgi:hypothetical protein
MRPRPGCWSSGTRDEIHEIYISELNARDLTQPSDAVLNAAVDRVSGNPLPAVRLAAESLAQAAWSRQG